MATLIIPEAYKWLDITGINIKEGIIYQRANILTVLSIIVLTMEFLQLGFNIRDINIVAGVIEVCAPVYLVTKTRQSLKIIMFSYFNFGVFNVLVYNLLFCTFDRSYLIN